MKSIAGRYDKLAESMTLNGAIFVLAMGMLFFCSAWFFDFGKFVRTKDDDWLWIALCSVILGLCGVVHGILSIHAVARHLVATSRNSL